ncbi:MAG: DUF3179 domain-containing protein [Acidobacteriota bacterium]
MRSQSARRAVGLAVALLPCAGLLAQVANGFDLAESLVPRHEIRGGGPPRDGIPALTDPMHESVEMADGWLDPDDRIVGLTIDGESAAYPIRILNWHEVVNDVVGGKPVVITFCPLCGTGVVFDASLGGQRAIFGVSGLLYNSDVLLYDRRTQSLFSQLMFQAITGPLRGTKLETIPVRITTWNVWKTSHPRTTVLTRSLPYLRDYGTDPYARYKRGGGTMFPVRGADRSRTSKEWAYLVLSGKTGLVIAEELLRDASSDDAHRFMVGGRTLVDYHASTRELLASEDRAAITVIPGYWFALTAFHPEAHVVRHEELHPAGALNQASPS